MTLQNFMTLAAVCASTVHPPTFLTVAMQESKDDIRAINMRDHYTLSYKFSTLKEAIKTSECLEQNRHNFDINWGQFNVRNLKWLGVSFSDVFYPCKDLKVVRTALTHSYEQKTSKYNSERTELQSVINFYNLENFRSGFTGTYIPKTAFYVEGEASVLISEESQESAKLHTRKQEQHINTDALPPPSEELADVFTHKASGVRDAFVEEGLSSLERQQE
ncbi:trwN protein [Bartonella harrusi]|uniref:TrwN protein n=1 Tax=Bartonella harrusi TaxID=2961895 RepID=A0ABY5ETY2_9HYPH|nr:trwN protein [Bartonella harrusi]UTO28296.1 trwN protein [Bartonella harrusi]